MTFEPGTVVVVPFPFTDRRVAKRRPALVLSAEKAFHHTSGHVVLAMITSNRHDPWPLDVPVRDLASAGLTTASVVRMKLFTLDQRLVLKTAGKLAPEDHKKVRASLKKLFP